MLPPIHNAFGIPFCEPAALQPIQGLACSSCLDPLQFSSSSFSRLIDDNRVEDHLMPAFKPQKMALIMNQHCCFPENLGFMLVHGHVMQELGGGIILSSSPLLVTPGPGAPTCRSALDSFSGSLLRTINM